MPRGLWRFWKERLSLTRRIMEIILALQLLKIKLLAKQETLRALRWRSKNSSTSARRNPAIAAPD